MAAPFPEAQDFVYMVLGALFSLVVVLGIYIRRLHHRLEKNSQEGDSPEDDLKVDNIGLTKKSQDVMKALLEDPCLQSDLPERIGVSKATVSNAVSELKERNLIIRKKRGNTYLIEPDIDELEKQQR